MENVSGERGRGREPRHQIILSARVVAHSRSRLTHTVRRLEKDGYVERFSCTSDGRGVNCRLTEAGAAFLGQAAPVHLAGVRRHVVDRFTPDQLASLADLLEVLATPEGQSGCGQPAA